MGGELYAAPAGKAPTFLVAALKDLFNGNLNRIQVVKGWLDDEGETNAKWSTMSCGVTTGSRMQMGS
jgi:hypothetical protein